ncbi:MAG TPA: M28 family metallopeptidase [Nitriliruptorales bacterium]|nr:M28 family metallopeptidase [Nitriliruptorales bacterium]
MAASHVHGVRACALVGWAGLVLLLAFAAVPSVAAAAPPGAGCDNRNNNTIEKLLACADLDGARAHQATFQEIADANGGTRASGTPGYDKSVDHVVDRMTSWGYDVSVQQFEFPFFHEASPAELEQLAPVTATYETGTFTYSGSGDVTGGVVPVDLSLADPAASTSGCEAGDFAGLDLSGGADIALIQRGACFFLDKALNAQQAGAEAVVIFNQGTDGREGLIVGTLTEEAVGVITVPVVGATFPAGQALAQAGSVARVFADTLSEIRTTENVLAQTRRGRTDNVVMAGAHLDSVPDGPGIQDNGTGSAALLEIAQAMRKVKPENAVRFAWWGAEEFGLIGSEHYVNSLSQEEQDNIALYLNFDMIGSPNYVRFVYDGDGSAFGLAGPDGSGAIEELFVDFYADRGLASEPTEISFRSDYAAFFDVGIPFGGLFTGAEGIKTAEQQAIYGGTVGEQYDPCYHLACDTFDNISLEVFDLNIDAVAAAVLTYASSTESINGVPGRPVPASQRAA